LKPVSEDMFLKKKLLQNYKARQRYYAKVRNKKSHRVYKEADFGQRWKLLMIRRNVTGEFFVKYI
jgi:hypothetical protein